MYTKETKLSVKNNKELSDYIEGYDVYNSGLLSIINDPDILKESYLITVYEYRPDLIAEDYYGSSEYLGLLLVQTKLGLENYTKGTILRLIPKTTLDKILENI